MNIFRSISLPAKVRKGDPVKADDYNAILNALQSIIKRMALPIMSGAEIGVRPLGNSLVLFLKNKTLGGSASGTSGPCLFGTLVPTDEDPPGTAILGGPMICGDKNFNISDHSINLETDGEWLISIKLTGIECATDDDGEIFLPGVITATGTPAWDNKDWTDPTDYDDTTNPTGPSSPDGDIVVPLGRLKVADGIATYSPAGCGMITVGQCAGILNHRRG